MKTVRLSSPTDRKNAWGFAVFLFLLIAVILRSVSRGTGYFLLISLCSLFSIGLVTVYLSAVTKAAVEVDGDGRLEIRGLVTCSEDCSGAVTVKTAPVSAGPVRSRSILLCDAQGETVCSVATMFISHEGAMAEPAAMELAALLGLGFEPTVEKWKYDKEAMREHREEEKRQKKEKRSRRKSGASPVDDSTDNEKASGDGINYDAMDDER